MRLSVRVILFFQIIVWSGVGFSVPFAFTYAGRLLDGSGNPLSGSQSVQITFWDAQTGGNKLAANLQSGTTNDTYTVNVVNGVFSQVINLSAANFHTVFPDSTTGTWVQVEAAGITYPRQQFTAVPYALKVPVDGTTIGYNSSGQLELKTLSSSQLPSVITSSSDATFNSVKVGRGASSVETNSAVGFNALYSNTTGAQNTALGYGGLYANTTGTGNTGLGYASLNQNTTGLSNTAVGRSALHLNLTGSYNTAMGFYALYENTTGVQNSAFGHGALQNNNANNNTAVGLLSLQNNTSGTNNTAIGFGAGQYLTTGSNNTIIGAHYGTAGLSNTVIISAGSTERMRIDSSGNVGIGTTSPSAPLSFSNTVAATNTPTRAQQTNKVRLYSDSNFDFGFGISNNSLNIAANGDSTRGKIRLWTDATERMTIDHLGNVGIGKAAPTSKLDVSGDVVITDGQLRNNHTSEKTFRVTFSPAAANQAVFLILPNTYINGSLEVSITSAYSQQNAAGQLTKLFAIGANPVPEGNSGATSTWSNSENTITQSIGPIRNNFTIGDFSWDGNRGKYVIPIYHIVSTTNHLGLHVRYFSQSNPTYDVLADTTLSEIETVTIPTAYLEKQYQSTVKQLNVNGEVKFGNTSSTCNATTEGQQRYNSTSKSMEFCNGTAWTAYGTSTSLGVPAGTVIYSARSTPPSGYLPADGSAVSRTTYADLFAAIGTTFGSGNGSTTFNLPDLRGEFIRGWDNSRGVDAGRTLGSSQSDAFKSHRHNLRMEYGAAGNTSYPPPNSTYMQLTNGLGYPLQNGTNGQVSYEGDSETRPRNIALLPCIKH